MRKGQAAMEFLMTYGWAILIVLAAIGALAYFGVLNPQKLLAERTIFQAPIQNIDNAVIDSSANSVEIAFRNNKGVSILLPLTGLLTPSSGTTCTNVTLSGNYKGAVITNTTIIPNGASFILKWDCEDLATVPEIGDKFKADLLFDYQNSESEQFLTQTGYVEGKYNK